MRGMDAVTGRSISGIEHLKQSVRDILTTPIGSRVMRRDYGSRLFLCIDRPLNDDTIADIVSFIAEALKKWEPRINVTRVVINNMGPGFINLNIEGVYRPNGQKITLDGIEVS
ncbi:GPW/gp25 family protein [Shewanella surugensis]|uniref:GPW/gp25 family protein n=1 Tax=Shewanella surugensis TaxID=212020 RepID=A0ABT0LAG9_9GAMM|nr:GPW/gp25 family protein [Shewanella surugensis]MCL1124161.1 GPW/gp25 family protein [Shewanella surugensis]